MDTRLILEQLDNEISQLQQVKALLQGTPNGNGNGNSAPSQAAAGRKPLSAAARKKIAAAQRRRWAKVRSAKA